MTTIEALGRGWAAVRDAQAAERERTAGTVKRRAWPARVLAEHGLSVAAFGCFTAAAWMLAVPAGLAVAGLSLLVLELRMGGAE
jgi:hypothetical protein